MSVQKQLEANEEVRATYPALRKGWRRKCPSCCKGSLMEGYLKVRPACDVCGEAFYHHRADDGPAYLTILIVGHVTMPMLHFAFVRWRPDPVTLLLIFGVGCVLLSLYLLPRLKGAIVAFQWARYMHGFSEIQQSFAQKGENDRR